MVVDAYAVIMAGGKGERFWPVSTRKHPKQVLSLVGGKPMLAQAVERVETLIPPENVYVITSADLVDITRESVARVPAENIIGEPFGRDTAAAVALGAALVEARNPQGVMAVLTADHVIGDPDIFVKTIAESLVLAAGDDVLITMGILPEFPSTGFGYIDAGDAYPFDGVTQFFRARRFVEKPGRPVAEDYLAAGHYFWNSGMFVWSLKSILSAFERHQPPLRAMIQRLRGVAGTPQLACAIEEEYGKLEKISIDYAVMEKANNILMAKGTFRWDDIGSWPAIGNHFEADDQGNVAIGDCEAIDSQDNVVYSRERLTALIGVKDLVVVQAEGATLICPKARAQEVKAMVKRLAERGDSDALL